MVITIIYNIKLVVGNTIWYLICRRLTITHNSSGTRAVYNGQVTARVIIQPLVTVMSASRRLAALSRHVCSGGTAPEGMDLPELRLEFSDVGTGDPKEGIARVAVLTLNNPKQLNGVSEVSRDRTLN